MFSRQAVEQYDFVQPVQELWAEMSAHNVHDLRFEILDRLVIGHLTEILTTEVRGQDDQRV